MKKIYLSLVISTLALALPSLGKAQNVQLHYDFGHLRSDDLHKERPVLTSTVEMFRPDRWGSTFFFIDMDYKDSGIKSAYWEIARDLRFWSLPISLHLEYNGGLSNRFSYNDAYLLGASYSYNAPDHSYGFGITPSYKYLAKYERPHSAQLTATWYCHFANGLLSFTGFADLWADRDAKGDGIPVFLSEPQLWFNFNKLKSLPEDFNLSIGTEVELSYNFPTKNETVYAIPTIAMKWTF
ncbi:MAG: DUF5020 family protein [Porphyromonas sp.]|nr:DUF5020 family protein [Porphyromonas sp.]